MRHLTHAIPRARRALIRRTTGVGITALATLAAGVATANTANADVWDSLAACESGGNWSISTGNGYYGGLQFSRSTWVAYGGGAYAATANQASRDHQIAIAQRVLAGQGPRAWPTCAPRAGLTRGSGGSSAAPAAASRSTTRSTGTKVAAKPTTRKAATPSRVAASGKTVTVRSGDTLSKLAAARGISWQSLYAANRAKVSNPNLIYVGQVLNLPA